MKIHLYIIFLLTLSIGLISCEKEATIDPPKVGPKLVVAAFISPQDTLIRINLSKSVPIFGSRAYGSRGSDGVPDATVILSDGNSSVTLTFDPKEGRYTVDSSLFKIQAGRTYFLNVSTPDGLKADAQCTVPEPNNTFTLGELDSTYSGNSTRYKITFRWEDNPLTSDYYSFDGEVFIFMEGRRPFSNPLDFDEEDSYIADTQISSSTFIRKGEFQYGGTQGMKREIHGYLLSTDVHYYKYHKGIQNYSGDNPFAEPVLLYSNVNGGLGVFCSYNLRTVIKE